MTTAPPGKAILVNGRAIPPADAPPAVKRVIAAANKIRTKPYIYGGGHARWWDAGYDCSGAVSFALRGAGLIDTPMPSGSLAGWGSAGKGRWITVYANGGHAYAIIAGLRWDTAGTTSGTGPRWHKSLGAASQRPLHLKTPRGLLAPVSPQLKEGDSRGGAEPLSRHSTSSHKRDVSGEGLRAPSPNYAA